MAVASTAAPAHRFRPRSFGRSPGPAGRRPAALKSPRAGGGAASRAACRRYREVRSPVGPASSPEYSPALFFPFFLFLSAAFTRCRCHSRRSRRLLTPPSRNTLAAPAAAPFQPAAAAASKLHSTILPPPPAAIGGRAGERPE